jgi:hypothetical protein
VNTEPNPSHRLADDASAFLRSTGVKVVAVEVVTLLVFWFFQEYFGR